MLMILGDPPRVATFAGIDGSEVPLDTNPRASALIWRRIGAIARVQALENPL